MTSPLVDVRVLELASGVAGAFAGHLLRGYGADVLRVEPASVTSLTADEVTYLHAGKRQTQLTDLPDLLAGVDIVLSDAQPGGLKALGIDWAAIRAAHPHLLIVSVTPFGLTGPYADFQATNAVSFAMGGIMSLTGDPGRTPLVTGGNQAQMLAGLNAFAATVTCWFGRTRHGAGEFVDLSAQECAAGMLELYGPSTAVGGPVMPRLGNHVRASWAIYPCLDGWAGAFALERQIPALFRLLDDAELDEPRFREPLQRYEPLNEEALTAKLYVWMMDKTKAELLQLGLDNKVPIGIAVTPKELLSAPGLHARGALDVVGDVTMPGRPFPGFDWMPQIHDSPWTPRHPAASARARRPLEGVRVVDLTMMWAGPFATLQLASMGAEVIKVESPSAWDNIRTLVPQPGVADPWNSAYYFNAYNRDKKSLTLDLATDDGRRLLLRLLAESDVLIENYRADVLDKLGITDEVLNAANPKLVTVSMAAFGKEGPDRAYVGFGPVIELMSGLASLSGYKHDDEPFKTGISYGDPVAGLGAVAAIALGLLQRDTTGQGCHIDLAQRETSMVMIGEAFVAASRGDEIVHRGCGDARFDQDVYRCLGDDQWLVVSIRNETDQEAVRDLIGLDGDLRSWLATRRPQDAMEALQGVGVPAGRMLDTGTIHDDLQLLHRDYWVYLPHPNMPRYKQQGITWRLADADPRPQRHAPFFGEHNHEILTGLGVTDSELDDLAAKQVIADAPINPGVG